MAEKQTIDAMWDDSPVDVSTEVNFIWSIANKLRGTYQSDKYKDVIIPMVIIRRFECALAPTKQKVVDQFKANPAYPAKAMYRVSGYQFYNTSEFDLAELVNDADHLAANFKSYIQGFSANIQDIIKSLDFDKQIDKMDKNNRLLSVVKAFSELDLNPVTIDNVKMGYIFEDLIRRFSENAEAGDHYTGRDIIKLMVNILLAEGCDDIFDDGKVITVLDQACGTGGMLSTSYNFIKRYNPSADVRLFGQEINPESYAICLAEMMIKGQNAENICYQDTMKADRFKGTKMRFVIENPPFGTPWGGKDAAEGVEQAVNDEYTKGFDGRWGAGLPGSGDMQMLFLQSAIDKMDDNFGRAAIIENGSPLFSGGTASGESQIRRWMLENDLIEAIIALPTDLFYNTGIATYIWVLSKNKRRERKGKIQLIDASGFYGKLRKALGNKKNEISSENRTQITKLYADFAENEYCKIYKNEEFIFYRFCQKAANHPDKDYFFIIDEINRGNMSKIFGELLMLIEADYRDKKATLAYNGLSFSVPKRLHIIGMMNTADRSLAMIDYALRRRFSFFDMEPGFDSEGFINYQNSFANETFNTLIERIKELNKEIAQDKSLGKGFCIGHSYFCNADDRTEEWMKDVVDFDILPMLSEYWFDESSKLQRWENILHGVFQ